MILNISEAANLALHAMYYLALHQDKKLIPVAEVTDSFEVSKDHMNKVLQRLKKIGLVDSTRGPHGGFRLRKAPEAISLLMIYEAIDGPLMDSDCLMKLPECKQGHCIFGDLIGSIQKQTYDYFSNTTLQTLIDFS